MEGRDEKRFPQVQRQWQAFSGSNVSNVTSGEPTSAVPRPHAGLKTKRELLIFRSLREIKMLLNYLNKLPDYLCAFIE